MESETQLESEDESETQETNKNPSISNPHWEDAEGKTITKSLVGDEVYLCADVIDIDDGKTANIKIVEKDDDGNDDDVDTISGKVQDGKIKTKWKVIYTEDNHASNSQQEKDEKGYTLPEYTFIVECDGVESDKSEQLDVMGWIHRKVIFEQLKRTATNLRYVIEFPDNSTVKGTINKNGFIDLEETKYKYYKIQILFN